MKRIVKCIGLGLLAVVALISISFVFNEVGHRFCSFVGPARCDQNFPGISFIIGLMLLFIVILAGICLFYLGSLVGYSLEENLKKRRN